MAAKHLCKDAHSSSLLQSYVRLCSQFLDSLWLIVLVRPICFCDGITGNYSHLCMSVLHNVRALKCAATSGLVTCQLLVLL